MDDFIYPKPVLTEPGVKYFLHQTLKQCHLTKEKFYNLLFNLSIFFIFLIILALILYFKYKGKLSPLEIKKKEKEKQQYILSKIKNFQQSKRQAHQELITGLPAWESEYDNVNIKYY